MSLTKLRLPAGVYRNGTAYESQGRWLSSNMVRWFSGTIRPVGGWIYAGSAFLDGAGRGIVTWRANSYQAWAGIGTPNKLWAFDGDVLSDITPAAFPAGNVNTAVPSGYGSGNYGAGNYGSSPGGTTQAATTWSVDHFGQNLVACASHDRVIYEWALVVATPAAAVAGAPTANACFVTNERFLVALGAGSNPRTVQWSDQEADTTWTPTALNQAGSLNLQTSGIIIKGLRVRGHNIILTTTDCWTMKYIGPQLVYSFELAGDKCGLIGPNAAVAVDGGAFWMGSNGFYRYDGNRVTDLDCDVFDYVFSDINLGERAKVNAAQNSAFNEVTWWFCSKNSTTIDKAVTYNYAENHWAIHATPYLRSCWADADVFDWPLACSDTGRIYFQERGWLNNTLPRTSQVYAQSGPVEIGNGDQTYMIRQVIPDEVTPGAWQARFAASYTPEGASISSGTLALLPYTDVRLSGRQMTVQIEGVTDADNRIGVFRVDNVPASGR